MILLLATASAFSTGFSPSPPVGSFDCGQCHNQTGSFLDLAPPEDRPVVRLERLDGEHAAEVGFHRLRLTVETTQDPSGRRLGFAMAVVPQEGADFSTRTGELGSDDVRTQSTGIVGVDLTHAAPLEYSEGQVTLELEMEVTEPGEHLIYVVVNDVDGDGAPSTGDLVWNQRFCFSTEDGGALGPNCDQVLESAPVEEPIVTEGGCSTTGSGPVWLGMLGLVASVSLRRRRLGMRLPA